MTVIERNIGKLPRSFFDIIKELTLNLDLKFSSIDYSGEFIKRFKTVKHLANFKSTMYRRNHQRNIDDLDVVTKFGLADSDLSRCIDSR